MLEFGISSFAKAIIEYSIKIGKSFACINWPSIVVKQMKQQLKSPFTLHTRRRNEKNTHAKLNVSSTLCAVRLNYKTYLFKVNISFGITNNDTNCFHHFRMFSFLIWSINKFQCVEQKKFNWTNKFLHRQDVSQIKLLCEMSGTI